MTCIIHTLTAMIKLILTEKIDFYSLYEDIKNNSVRTARISKNLTANVRSNDDRSIDRSIYVWNIHFVIRLQQSIPGLYYTQQSFRLYTQPFFLSIMK